MNSLRTRILILAPKVQITHENCSKWRNDHTRKMIIAGKLLSEKALWIPYWTSCFELANVHFCTYPKCLKGAGCLTLFWTHLFISTVWYPLIGICTNRWCAMKNNGTVSEWNQNWNSLQILDKKEQQITISPLLTTNKTHPIHSNFIDLHAPLGFH